MKLSNDPIWGMMEELHHRVERLKQLGLIKLKPKSVFEVLGEAFDQLGQMLWRIFYE